MSSAIIDLQKEIVSSSCDLSNVMRKAHLIARKLKLMEFDKWVYNELNGYSNTPQELIPSYRLVHCRVIAKYRTGQSNTVTMPSTEFENMVSYQYFKEPIAEIQEIYNENIGGSICSLLQPEINLKLNEISTANEPLDFILTIGPHAIKSILEKVKNNLLDWLIELEEAGIEGEDMVFTKNDSEVARTITNNYYGSVINGDVSSSPIVNGNVNSITYNTSDLNKLLGEIKGSLNKEKIREDDRQEAIEMLEDVYRKVQDNKKPKVIRSALLGLKDLLINVGANVTATLITQYL